MTDAATRGSINEALAGVVECVTFHNAETGFCVLRVKARGQRDLITVVGHYFLNSKRFSTEQIAAVLQQAEQGIQHTADRVWFSK